MKLAQLKTLSWALKLQWRTSRLAFSWRLFEAVFNGLRPIAQTYFIAQLLAEISAVVAGSGENRMVYIWLISLFVLEFVNELFIAISRLVGVRFEHLMQMEMHDRYFAKIYELNQEQLDDEKFVTQLDRARDALFSIGYSSNDLTWTISTFVGLAGSISAVFVASVPIGLLILVIAIPISYLYVRQNNLREEAYKLTEPIDRQAYRTRWILLDPNQMPEIRLMNGFRTMIQNWRKNTGRAHKSFFKHEVTAVKLTTLAELFRPIISLSANIYFFQRLLAGLLSFDQFIFLRGMIEQSTNASQQFGSSIQRLHDLSIKLDNFHTVFATKPVIPRGTVKPEPPLSVRFEDVSFTYPGSEVAVLQNLSFAIQPGDKVAVVGENGAGKTTLIRLLLRLYLPSRGTIWVNDTDMAAIDQQSYTALLSNLSQQFFMISHLTIEDNLTIGLAKKPSHAQIDQALELVGIADHVRSLPHRLKTRLDSSFDDGTNFSGGQQQRLGVARALLRGGDILILDEPTSAIDAKAEYKIFNNIYAQHEAKTTLIVSHRFSTVRKADKIFVMEGGTISAQGSHDELMKQSSLYREMFEAQAEGYR
jgi:ATP-binding cassette subfamily B protein